MSMTFERNRVSNYYSITMGKVVKSLGKVAPVSMEGVTKRTNKNGDEVFEIVSDGIRGTIIAVELKQPEQGKEDFGSQVCLTLESEDGDKAVLQFKFDSAYGRGFMQCLPDIDKDQPVEFEPYQYFAKEKGKDVSGMSIYQHGVKLAWNYTRDNVNGMPALEQVVFKGATQWDNTKQLNFLTDKLNAFISGFVPRTDSAPVNEAPPLMPEDNDADEDQDSIF